MYAISMGTSVADGGIGIGTFATDWTNDVLFGEIVPNALGGFLESIGVAGWLYGLIMDGIVAGVGAVLGFVPQMLVLFFLLSILEDVGTWPVSLHHGPYLPPLRSVRQELHPHSGWYRLRRSRCYGFPYHRERA